MKLLKGSALLIVLVVAAAAALGWLEIRRGFSARATPSSVEVVLATTARELALPAGYRRLRQPMSATPENIQAGMTHFADHCATCHANNGGGDTLFGRGLYPKPPDLRASTTQNKSDGELYYIIENGVRLSGMPAFGEHPGTSDMETWHLVLFIRHLPALTDAELAQMGTLNPKTEQDRQEEKEEQEFLNEGNPQPESNSSNTSQHHHQ